MSRSAKGFCHGLWGAVRIFSDPHALHAWPEGVAVDRVAIVEKVRRRGVIREGVDDLLGRPGGRGMLGDVEVEDAPRCWAGATRMKRTRN